MPTIDRLLELMARLRDPVRGCPWDLEQDFSTIAPYTIEEAYEVEDAIRRSAWPELCEELGDLLLQVVFHAQMAHEAGHFDFDDVANAISEKLVRRHPNVFGGAPIASAAEQSTAWDAHKAREREARGQNALDSVPRALPALLQAAKLVRRSEQARAEPGAETHESIGDELFALARRAALRGIEPETALRDACERFRARHASR